MSGVDADYASVTGDTVIGTGDDAEYEIVYINNDYKGEKYQDVNMSTSYEAKLVDSTGKTVSNGVSPSSGDLDNGVSQTLTVSAPDDAGRYTLQVVYTTEVTYKLVGEDGEVTTPEPDKLERTEELSIRVVEPITLSVTLTNDSNSALDGFAVYFYVDGNLMEDSRKTVSIDAGASTTVTYDWITDAGNGQHEFYVSAAGEEMVDVVGLGETHTFYIGDSDYTWLIALLVVVIILVLIIMVWVYRKPVKNYGKPKSRR